MARMFSPDGSCPIDELTYREAQRICKMLGLRAVGRRQVLEDRLSDYEEEKGIWLKIFLYMTVSPDGKYLTSKKYSYKILEVAKCNTTSH